MGAFFNGKVNMKNSCGNMIGMCPLELERDR